MRSARSSHGYDSFLRSDFYPPCGPQMSLLYSSMPAASAAASSEASGEVTYRLKRIDTLVESAPLRGLVAGTAPEPLESSMGPGPPQLVAATGHGHQGSLTIMQRSLVPNVILAVPFTGLPEILCCLLAFSWPRSKCLLFTAHPCLLKVSSGLSA